MTTERRAPKLLWDERKVVLTSLAASWVATAPPLTWQKIIEHLRLSPADDQRPTDTFPSSTCSAISSPGKHGLNLFLSVHDGSHAKSVPSGGGEVESHWKAEFWTAPKAASDEIVKKSHLVGGYADLLSRLGEAWPTREPLKFRVSAAYMLDGKYHKLNPVLLPRPGKVQVGPLALKLGAVLWEIAGADGESVVTITTLSRSMSGVTWSGTLRCSLDSTFISALDKMAWEAICPLMKS